MTGRREVPASAIDIAEAKRGSNVSAVVPIGRGSEVYIKNPSTKYSGGRIVVRGEHVKPSNKLGTKAKAMRACAGKKACDFESCLEAAGITPPRSIRKACGH
jgi:hypothetical protein